MYVGLTSGMNEISALSSSVRWFCGTPLPNWAPSSMNVVNYCVVIWSIIFVKDWQWKCTFKIYHRYLLTANLILAF